MNIIQALKSLFQRQAPAEVPDPAIGNGAQKYRDFLLFDSLRAEQASQQPKHNLRVRDENQRLSARYGPFESFLYRPYFDGFLRQEVIGFLHPKDWHLDFLDTNHWPQRHPFNFPGPFYAGESDTCGTGVCEAPDNVMNDAHGCEYVFRQPATHYELCLVLNAAAVEVLDSYSANGNEYWTYDACKVWWRNREQLVHHLLDQEVAKTNNGQEQQYLAYLRGPAEMDLRRYCFFLENGAYPTDESVALPEL